MAESEQLGPRLEAFRALGPRGFLSIGVTEWGPRASEQVVVCLHGLTRNARDFDFLARRLAAKGMRVVAPDLPGRGRSQWVENGADYATPLYMATMAAVIARTGVDKVDWVGTSLGGHIGMELAAREGAPIRRLVLNDFGARISGAALQRIGTYLRIKRHFDSVVALESHLRTIHEPFGRLTDEQWRHMAENSAVKTEEGDWRQHFDPAIARAFAWPLMVDIALWDVWEKVDCPVLILRGEDSDLLHASTVRDMMKRGTAAKKGWVRSVEVRDCGHAPALMSDSQISLVEEFLLAERPKAKVHRLGSRA